MALNRRELCLATIVGALFSELSAPREAAADDAKYDISYFWAPNIDDVLDYKQQVEEALGPLSLGKLEVVAGKRNYGLIQHWDGMKLTADALAWAQSRMLEAADLDKAISIKHNGYEPIYNVSFGVGPNLEALKASFGKVYAALDESARSDLAIEQAESGKYALVYRSLRRRTEAGNLAKRYGDALRGKGVKASVIAYGDNDQVYGETDYLAQGGALAPTPPRASPKPETNRPKKAPARKGGGAPGLEARIERHVDGLRREGRIAQDETTAWVVYDHETGEKYASINEDVQMPVASLIKLQVMTAFFHETRRGHLAYDAQARRKLERMIRNSDNNATNWAIDRIGGPRRVQEIISESYGRVFPDTRIVEKIPAGGKAYGNVASAHDYSRFLYGLWRREMPRSEEMLRLMGLPNRDRIYVGVPNIPSGTLVFDKTGTTARFNGDAGIIYAQDKRGRRHAYTIVGMISKASRAKHYGSWGPARSNVIREISGIVYDHMKRKHGLR